MAAIDAAKLRSTLRRVFDKFDADGSGSVNTMEMRMLCEDLHMDLSEEAVWELMLDSDPDASGAIDFEEFVGAVQRQLAAGQAVVSGQDIIVDALVHQL